MADRRRSGGSRRAITAGLAYAAVVFGVGFVLGALRVVVVEPRVGSLWAVALELPLILAASWWLCGHVLRRLGPLGAGQGLAAGVVAFAALVLLEAGFALTQESPVAYLVRSTTAAGALGLAGQVVFATFPLLHPARQG